VRILRVLLALLCFLGAAHAQTLGAALSVSSSGALEPELQLRGLALEGVTFDLRAALPLGGAPSGGVAARTRTSFGPLGTVALIGRADASVAGAFDLGVSATGALAQWGFDGALEVFNRNPGAFAPLGAFDLAARPFLEPATLAGGAFDLTVGLTRRVTRTTLLELRPTAYLTGMGAGGRLEGVLQLRRLIGNDTGAALLLTAVAPEGGTFGAAGFEYRLSRAGFPPASAALLLGVDETGVRPGLRAAVSGEAQGLRYRAALSAEPYRTDAPPYRATVSVNAALGGGSAALELGAAPGNPFGVPPLLLRATYTFDL
jgi:hypothetical protein